MKKRIGSAGFVISCMALWFLLMPATLYGVLGSVAVFVLACVSVRGQQALWKGIKENFHIVYILPVGLICWVAAQKFYERWLPSGTVAAVAAAAGLESGALLAAAGILGAAVSLPALFAAAGWVCRAAKRQNPTADGGQNAVALSGKIHAQDAAFFLLLSLCIGLQLALSPWSNGYPGSDSTVFLYIGQRMREGLVPYRDLFDHKGLLLYFIEYLGLCIGNGNFTGVWLLEILNLFVTGLLFFQITKLFSGKKAVQYAASALALCAVDCYIVYEGGNLTEEYALPWISLALYIFLKYFMEDSYRFSEILLLGVSFTAVLFLRVNMIAVWAAFLPVVLAGMIFRKKWADIGKCVCGFLLGALAGLAPFFGYCLATGSLSDMLRYYIGFNFGYSDSESGLLPLLATAWFLLRQTAVWIAALAASCRMFYRNRIWRLNLWFLFVTLALASMSGRLYYHYGMILLPAMLVPIAMLLAEAAQNRRGGEEKYLIGLAGVFLAVMAARSALAFTGPEKSEIAAYIEENTAPADTILVLGNDCRYYLETGRNASSRFFYQTPPINVSDELYEEFVTELSAEKPELLILIGDKDGLRQAGDNLADLCGLLEEWEADGIYVYAQGDGCGFYRKSGE